MDRGFTFAIMACVLTLAARAADWPQLQGNPGHTGYTSDQPKPPFTVKWTRNLGEPTHTGSPVIVADGKVFTGTAWGNLLALDRETGKTVWTYSTHAPITSTPAFHDGLVFTTSMDHRCHAVNAKDGQMVWSFETDEGIWAGPVVAAGKVFLAGRDGFVCALNPRDGTLIWKTATGGMAMATPAFAEGVLFVPAGDNRIYALDGRTGKPLWTSAPLPGAAIREYWLVAAHGVVVATTQLAFNSHQTYGMIEQAIMEPFRQANDGKMLVQEELLKQVAAWYEKHPHQRTFHVLDAKSGQPKCYPPIVPVHGGSCVGPLPVIAPDGFAYVMYANVRLRASGWAFPGRLDLASGHLEPLIKDRYWINAKQWEWQPKPGTSFGRRSTFDVGFCVSDQSWGLAMGGDHLFTVRDPGWPESEGAHCFINLKTGEDAYLVPRDREIRRAVLEGVFGGAFHSTCSPMAVSGNQIFHKAVRNVVVCFEGSE